MKSISLTLCKKVKDIYPTQNKWIFEVASILLTVLTVKLAAKKQPEVDLF